MNIIFMCIKILGHGETIAKFCLAHAIVKDMEYGKSAQAATQTNLDKMTGRLKNTAGAITLSPKGDVGIYFTSNRMSWAYRTKDHLHFGIEHNEDNIEHLN